MFSYLKLLSLGPVPLYYVFKKTLSRSQVSWKTLLWTYKFLLGQEADKFKFYL